MLQICSADRASVLLNPALKLRYRPLNTTAMKRILFVLLSLSIPCFLHAQFLLGFKGGLSTTEVNPSDIVIQGDGTGTLTIGLENINFGVHGGLWIRAEIGSFIIQPEFLYNSNKVDYRIEDFRSGATFDKILHETYESLDIPVMVGFKFGSLRLQGGPVAHLHLSASSELKEVPGYDLNFDEMTYGWQAGLGLDIWQITLDAKFEGNFTKLGDHMTIFGNDYDFDKTPNRIIASLGFFF